MCPTPRAPISTTTASVSSRAPSKVNGNPSSLLKERSLAAVTYDVASTDASKSLVDVLPTEPVTPTTGPVKRPRAARPRSARASAVSGTSIAVPLPSPAPRLVR